MIYEATGPFSQGIGKDVPAMGPFKNYQPRFARFGGRYSGIISGAIQIGTHVYKNYRRYTKLGSALIGAGVSGGINGKPIIHSTKHYKQDPLFIVVSGSVTTKTIVNAVAVDNKDAVNEVEEGAIVKAVYLEY